MITYRRLLLATFFVLSIAYSVATPIFEAPDELQHFAHIEYIARRGTPPPLGVPHEHLWAQQALQAPLYYWLSATVVRWVDTFDLTQQALLQPKANFGDPQLPGKKNAFLHPADQAFPYQNTTLAVHLARWVSTLISVGTVALTLTAARFILRDNPLAIASAGILAFTPQFLFISASVSNDPLITLTSTLTLVALLWVIRDGADIRKSILLGVAVGLMALSKLIGLALALLTVSIFICVTRSLKYSLFVVGLSALLAGWWYLRNLLIYGDPLAVGSFLRYVGGSSDITATSAAELREQFRMLRFSTWGLFGQLNVPIKPNWIYLIFDTIGGLGLLGAMCALFVQKIRTAFLRCASDNYMVITLVLWLGVVLVLGARWFLAAGIQGRLLFPGLPSAAILVIYGLRFLAPRIPARILAGGLLLPLATFSAITVPAYIVPAYSQPSLTSSVPNTATPIMASFADEITLRGFALSRDANIIRLEFYWQTTKTPSTDYSIAIRLVRPDGSFWLDYVNLPGMGTAFPTDWKVGELRRDDYLFDLNRFPSPREPLHMIVGFFDPRTAAMTDVGGGAAVHQPGWALLGDVDINRLGK